MNEEKASTLERLKRHGGPITRLGRLQYDIMSDNEAKHSGKSHFFLKPHDKRYYSRQITQAYSTNLMWKEWQRYLKCK